MMWVIRSNGRTAYVTWKKAQTQSPRKTTSVNPSQIKPKKPTSLATTFTRSLRRPLSKAMAIPAQSPKNPRKNHKFSITYPLMSQKASPDIQGLHTLHGIYPLFEARSRELNLTRLVGLFSVPICKMGGGIYWSFCFQRNSSQYPERKADLEIETGAGWMK